MKRRMPRWGVAALALVFAGSLWAHHSLTGFDTATAVRVKGVIVRFDQVNPHSFLFVDQKGADGKVQQRWAVEGPPPNQLLRMGVTLDTFKIGEVIEACGYVTNKGTVSERAFPPAPRYGPKPATTDSTPGRVMTGEQLVMRDGKMLPWSDYGHHKCLGPDYVDSHRR